MACRFSLKSLNLLFYICRSPNPTPLNLPYCTNFCSPSSVSQKPLQAHKSIAHVKIGSESVLIIEHKWQVPHQKLFMCPHLLLTKPYDDDTTNVLIFTDEETKSQRT